MGDSNSNTIPSNACLKAASTLVLSRYRRGSSKTFTPVGLNFEVDGNKAKISIDKGQVTGTVILERIGTSDPCCFDAWKISLEVKVGLVSGDIDIGDMNLKPTADNLGLSLCI